jgi:amino acid adenylation domain-containing protein
VNGQKDGCDGNEPIELPAHLSQTLENLSRSEGTTPFVAMLAVFKVLLARYYYYVRQEDIVVGLAIANREHAEPQPPTALFVNTVVLRPKLDGNPTFREVVRRVREVTLEAYQAQNLPLESVVEALAPECNLDRIPLYQVIFKLMAQPEPYSTRDLSLAPIEVEDRSAVLDLTMTLLDGRDGVRGYLTYNTNHFKAETVRRIPGHFRTVLEGIIANPEVRISELPLLTRPEREQLIVEWNNNRRAATNICLHELIEAQVERTPDAIALVSESESLTYRELNRRANRLGYRLRELGVRAEVIVGIFAESSIETVVGVVATLKAGGAYLPIDPSYPVGRVAFVLEEAKPSVVLAQRDRIALLPPYDGQTIFLDEDVDPANEANLTSGMQAENLAYVLYTSGSTGQPKGVMITHRGVTNRLLWVQESFNLTSSDCMMLKAPLTFDVSVSELFWPLIAGARVVVARPGLQGDSRRLIDSICKNRVTTLEFVPAMLAVLLNDQEVGHCLSLRRVISGGEALTFDLQERFFAALPHAELYNSYGPTETTIDVTFWKCEPGGYDINPPIGRPIANTKAYILDWATHLVPVGVVGELHIGGAQVASGYLARPELTAKAFVPNPFGEGRLYKTGDLARYREDGAIEFLGRIDQQVKLRGLRIEPGEIEAVLTRHPRVRDCVVVVREEEMEANQRLVAYIVANGVSPDELRRHAQQILPDYMVPSGLVFLDSLPVTAHGKLDRRALPEPIVVDREKRLFPPRDALETQLVAIWEKVLRIQPIGMADNFFQLGGDSLLAVRIFAEIEQKLGKRLPLGTLFQMPTVEKLAQKVREDACPEDWGPLVAIQLQGDRPPFFGIHGSDGNVLFYREFSRLLGKEQPFYGVQAQGLDGKPVARTSVEAMAAYYLEEMRKVQPHGPYLLGGYSFGGLAAYEIARHLRAAGEEVVLLVLFDTHNPTQPTRVRSWTQIVRQAIRRGITAKRILRFLAQCTRGKLGDNLLKWNESFHKLTLGRAATRGRNAAAELLDLRVQMVHERAFLAYRPLPYRGKVALFRTLDQDSAFEYDHDLGWSAVVQGGVEVHYVPGIHTTIFSDENAPNLARKVEECIRSALVKNK